MSADFGLVHPRFALWCPVLVCKKMPLVLSVLILVAAPLVASSPAQATDCEPISACEVLKHPREYMGQTFTFTGTFYHGVHATYFRPEEKCRGGVGIQAVGSLPPPTCGRASALVIDTGRIIVHKQNPQRMIGKPAEAIAFSVARVAKVAASPGSLK